MKKALITGIAGQDGSYLAEFLRTKGYEVAGVDKNDGDLLDPEFIKSLVGKEFDEIYNFASVSTVQSPWEDPVGTIKSTGLMPLYFLEAIRTQSLKTKFFQASSAEMFGDTAESPQSETTAFAPRSPYAYGKLLAHNAVEGFRSHGVFGVSGILFNHESPRRGLHFVTRKITSTLSRIARGADEVLELGNLDAQRDWSYAGDIVEAMWMSLQHDKPDTYVFASGEVHTVREFVEAAAAALDKTIRWEGNGVDEKGYDQNNKELVRVNPAFFRPVETQTRRGDISKIKKALGWTPKTSFMELVEMMVKVVD